MPLSPPQRIATTTTTIKHRNRQYEAAAGWLSRALELLPGGRVTPAWEATLLNLGHAARKLRQYSRAQQLYRQAIGLNPHSGSAYAGLAYTHQLAGDSAAAVECYHKALALKPEDAFASEMLGHALQEECGRFGHELLAADSCAAHVVPPPGG